MPSLTGKRVLLLRPEAQDVDPGDGALGARALFEAQGADVTQLALSRLAPPSDLARFAAARAATMSSAYDWVVFTSAHGVRRFLAELRDENGALAAFPTTTRIACIGPATAQALAPFGLTPSLVAAESHGEGLAEALHAALGSRNARILLARAEVARGVLPETLRAAGHRVEDVAVYRSELADDRAAALNAWLSAGGFRIVVFSSPSSVDAFLRFAGGATTENSVPAGDAAPGLHYVSIGPVTTARCHERQLRVSVEANPSTFPALAEAVGAHFTG